MLVSRRERAYGRGGRTHENQQDIAAEVVLGCEIALDVEFGDVVLRPWCQWWMFYCEKGVTYQLQCGVGGKISDCHE